MSGTPEQNIDGRSMASPPLALDTAMLATLLDVIAELGAARTRDEVVVTLRSRSRRLIGADGIAVILRDGEKSHYIAEDAIAPLWTGQSFPLEACASGIAMTHGQTIVVADALDDPRLPRDAYADSFARSLAVAPISPDAAIGAYWAEVGTPPAIAVKILETLARVAATAFETARQGNLVAAPAMQDAVTAEPSAGPEPAILLTTQEALAAFDHLPVLAWIADASGYIFRYNRAWFDYTGTTPQQMRGWGWQSVHHEEHLPRVLAAWTKALRTGEPLEITFPLLGADGVYRPFLTRAMPLRDASGAVVRWFGTNTDVSAIEAAETAAATSERLLKAVVDHIPTAIYVKDLAGRITMANQATLDVIGRPLDDIIHQTDAIWLDEAPLAKVQAVDAQVMANGAVVEIEEEVPDAQGGTRVFLSRKAPLRDSKGSVIGLIGSSLDVTERKRSQVELAEREDYLRRVLDQLFAFVGVTDRDGTLRFSNNAPLVAGGLVPDDVWGRPFWDCYWWSFDADTQAFCRNAVALAAAGEVYRADVVVRMANDTRVTIDYQASPLRDASGNITAVVHSGVVIEERVRAERLKETLIGELHHRVKNLFAMIGAMVQMTAASATETKAMAVSLNGRIMALARAHDLIRPIPGLTRIEEGTDLATIVRMIVAPYQPQRCHIAGDHVTIGKDAVTPLALIVHELATNAVKYGALSNDDGSVEIGWQVDAEVLTLEWVEKNGPPVSDAPQHSGFGSEIVSISAEAQLGGQIIRQWRAEGLSAKLTVPIGRLR